LVAVDSGGSIGLFCFGGFGGIPERYSQPYELVFSELRGCPFFGITFQVNQR
jgi:hypothetical protein